MSQPGVINSSLALTRAHGPYDWTDRSAFTPEFRSFVESVVRENVSRGAELLDREVPGWHLRIDPAALELASCERCVVGQLFEGGFLFGVQELFPIEGRADTDLPFEHGFDAGSVRDELFGEVVFLASDFEEEWLRAIKERCNSGVLGA